MHFQKLQKSLPKYQNFRIVRIFCFETEEKENFVKYNQKMSTFTILTPRCMYTTICVLSFCLGGQSANTIGSLICPHLEEKWTRPKYGRGRRKPSHFVLSRSCRNDRQRHLVKNWSIFSCLLCYKNFVVVIIIIINDHM